MATAEVRLYGALNELLPARLRGVRGPALEVPLDGSPAVKDVLEAVGVPHVEVSLLTVNGAPVSLAHRLRAGDRVAAYPVFHALEIPPHLLATPAIEGKPTFVLDGHLGTLARHLRLLGFDAAWAADAGDEALAQRSAAEGRVLLTRDRGLLKRGIVTQGYWLRGTEPRAQLAEVVRRYSLRPHAAPFTRCLRCGGGLEDVAKAEVLGALPPRVARRHERFRRCAGCRNLYWEGSHHERLRALLEDVLGGGPR